MALCLPSIRTEDIWPVADRLSVAPARKHMFAVVSCMQRDGRDGLVGCNCTWRFTLYGIAWVGKSKTHYRVTTKCILIVLHALANLRWELRNRPEVRIRT